jgi:uncharacterized membrane protein
MYVVDIFIVAVIILSLDAIFLTLTKDLFARQVLLVQGSAMKVNIPSAALCYALIVFGIYYFVLRHMKIPHSSSASASIQTMHLGDGVRNAFFLGILVYGVYETTTLAILRNWSPVVAVIDTTWGGTLFALTAYLFYYARWFVHQYGG